MSSWKVHLVAGGVVAVLAYPFVSGPSQFFQVFLGCLLFSILPDIDIKTSKIYGWTAILYLVINIAVVGVAAMAIWNFNHLETIQKFPYLTVQELLLSWFWVSIAWLVMQFAVHHGKAHSVMGIALMTLPAWIATTEPISILFFFLAGISHLVLDSFSSENALKWW